MKFFINNKKIFREILRNRIFSRNSFIPECLLGYRIHIHTGKKFMSRLITPNMLNLRFYQICPTKSLGHQIHIKKPSHKKKR